MAPFNRPYTTLYCFHNCKYSSICYHFCVIWRWVISRPWNMGSRSLKIIQNGTIRKLGCGFLFALHSNYGSVSHQFRHIGRKSWFFHTPLYSTPLLGGQNIAILFGTEKLECWGYPTVKKTLRICVTDCAQYQRVTDILPRHSQRYAYASRGKNGIQNIFIWPFSLQSQMDVLRPKR